MSGRHHGGILIQWTTIYQPTLLRVAVPTLNQPLSLRWRVAVLIYHVDLAVPETNEPRMQRNSHRRAERRAVSGGHCVESDCCALSEV